MTQITFNKWCVDPSGRGPVSVDPTRVECVEHFTDAIEKPRWEGDDYPREAAARIIMKNKKEYLVQGTHSWVVEMLNEAERLLYLK